MSTEKKAALEGALEKKMQSALSACFDDGLILEGESEFVFAIGGEEQFFDCLLPELTYKEKGELLNEYILTDADTQAPSILAYCMSRNVNPIQVYAIQAARNILDKQENQQHLAGIAKQHSDALKEAMRRENAGFDFKQGRAG